MRIAFANAQRGGRRRLAVLVLVCAGLLMADLRPSHATVDAEPVEQVAPAPLTGAEASSVGCALVAGSVGVAALAAGGVAIIAAEVGVGATSTAVAVPVVVTTMASGCTLGSVATPAILWLKRKGYLLGSAATAWW